MAPLAYATLGGVKRKLGITDAVDDAVLTDIIADVNQDVEDIAGRQIGPTTVTDETLDGYFAIEDGMCLLYPKGIRSVSAFSIADGTGESFTSIPSSDIVLLPPSYLRQPDWPAFEIWMSDEPTGAYTYFPDGYANLKMTAAVGWAAIPSTLTSAAETVAARTFLANRGGSSSEGSEETGIRQYRTLWRGTELSTLRRFSLKSVEII